MKPSKTCEDYNRELADVDRQIRLLEEKRLRLWNLSSTAPSRAEILRREGDEDETL